MQKRQEMSVGVISFKVVFKQFLEKCLIFHKQMLPAEHLTAEIHTDLHM